MDVLADPVCAATFTLWMLLVLMNVEESGAVMGTAVAGEEEDDAFAIVREGQENAVVDMTALMQSSVQNFRLCASLNFCQDEIRYWVKPRSTAWFSLFLMQQYDRSRWLSIFRMTKPTMFALAEVIRPHVQKKNTRYRLAIPVVVRLACTIFKLTQGATYTTCSEFFAIGTSTVSKVVREVVHAINDCLKHEIKWPTGDRMVETQQKFQQLCSMPAVVGALDGTHFAISKPQHNAPDYFYFKTGAYSMCCQAVVDSEKRFLDVFVGMPGSTNDSRVLRRSSLFHYAGTGNLLEGAATVEGFTPYLIADSGYPLLPWLITPHRDARQLTFEERLLNRKLKRGRTVVENAFGILKQSFRELMGKSELHLTLLPDVVFCCAILHNIHLRQSHDEVEEFMDMLAAEGMTQDEQAPQYQAEALGRRRREVGVITAAIDKRDRLGAHLARRPGRQNA